MTTVDSEEKRIAFVQIEIETLGQVLAERMRQEAKWGEQNHPNVPGGKVVEGSDPLIHQGFCAAALGIPDASVAKARCQAAAARGDVTWADIAIEELCEAIEAGANAGAAMPASPARVQSLEDLQAELIQCAAVFSAWSAAVERQIRAELMKRVEDAGSLRTVEEG